MRKTFLPPSKQTYQVEGKITSKKQKDPIEIEEENDKWSNLRFLDLIGEERENQRQKFPEDFDKSNSINDWVAFIIRYLGRVPQTRQKEEDDGEGLAIKRIMLVKAGALILATLENLEEKQKR